MPAALAMPLWTSLPTGLSLSMKKHDVTIPEIGLIAATRAMLGAGVYVWRGHDLKYVRIMKNLIRGTVLSLCFAIASMAYGAVPPLNVTVSDASGKVAFRGKTDTH